MSTPSITVVNSETSSTTVTEINKSTIETVEEKVEKTSKGFFKLISEFFASALDSLISLINKSLRFFNLSKDENKDLSDLPATPINDHSAPVMITKNEDSKNTLTTDLSPSLPKEEGLEIKMENSPIEAEQPVLATNSRRNRLLITGGAIACVALAALLVISGKVSFSSPDSIETATETANTISDTIKQTLTIDEIVDRVKNQNYKPTLSLKEFIGVSSQIRHLEYVVNKDNNQIPISITITGMRSLKNSLEHFKSRFH